LSRRQWFYTRWTGVRTTFKARGLYKNGIASRGRETAAQGRSLSAIHRMINDPINQLCNPLLKHSLCPILRAIVYYNDLSAFKWSVANCLDDLFDSILFIVTGDND